MQSYLVGLTTVTINGFSYSMTKKKKKNNQENAAYLELCSLDFDKDQKMDHVSPVLRSLHCLQEDRLYRLILRENHVFGVFNGF